METAAAAVQRKVVELGRLVVQMTTQAGSGHPSSALSLAHIVVHLMYRQMRWDPANPWDPAADRLVLSEGHAVPIVYAACADLGCAVGKSRSTATRLTVADLATLRARDSVLDGHPNPGEGFPFFDAATGSLGQGLSVAAGLALAAQRDGTGRRVYVLVGDGESREGQIWEAADFIAERNLTDICAVFNANGQGQAGLVSPQQSVERLKAKLAAFGWEVAEIDGHDPEQIAGVLGRVGSSQHPLAVVARTIKGWGVDELRRGNWHGKPVPAGDLPAALDSLDRQLPAHAPTESLGAPPSPAKKPPAKRVDPSQVAWPEFAVAMESAGLSAALAKKQLSTRRAYGVALKVIGEQVPQAVALDGDVSNSTFAEVFAKAQPDRFFEGKIAEQNLVSVAVGLSAAGYIPFVSSFAKFLARAYDQVELASISRANLKLVGSHAGISLAADGPSQMSLPDVAYFHALASVPGDDRRRPLCWLLHPADAVAAYDLTLRMAQEPGMCYLRTHRPDVPLLYRPGTAFELGGFQVLRPGEDVTLVAAGYMVHEVLKAAERLGWQKVRAGVVDAYCLPLDGPRLLEHLRRSGGRALVVEDNYGGGLGSAVAELAAADGGVRVRTLTCRRLPKSTRTAEEIMEYCGVGVAQIVEEALVTIR